MKCYRELIFRKSPKYINLWLIIIFIFLILFIFISCLYKFNTFYNINGLIVKEGSEDYVHVLVEDTKMDFIQNGIITSNNKEIRFTILDISNYFYTDNGKVYRELKLRFDNKYSNKQIVKLTFKLPKTTLIKKIKERIKEELI